MKKIIQSIQVADKKVFAIYKVDDNLYNVGLKRLSGYWTKRDLDRGTIAKRVVGLKHAEFRLAQYVNNYYKTGYTSTELKKLDNPNPSLSSRGIELMEYINHFNMKNWEELMGTKVVLV